MTNFLQEGALLRHQEQWVLLEGPFIEKSFHDSSAWSVYVSDFYDFNSEKEWVGAKTHFLTTAELKKLLLDSAQIISSPQATLATAKWLEPQKSDFEEAFSQIQNRIQEGSLQKAVPVVFAQTSQTVSALDLLKMIENLSEAPANLFIYGFWKNQKGFLGATPEVLFSYREKELSTMALAGTCPKNESTSRVNLLEDPKERFEHGLVVEDLKTELQNFGDVQVSETYVMELPSLYHLRTDMKVNCVAIPDSVYLLKKLHPTPALGVAPRRVGIDWMRNFPGQEKRQSYGAPIGFFKPSEGLCLVGIRNIQWDEKSARIGSGCGIVAESELEREWRELSQKRQSVRKILGL